MSAALDAKGPDHHLTRMIGHRSFAEIFAKDVLSPVEYGAEAVRHRKAFAASWRDLQGIVEIPADDMLET